MVAMTGGLFVTLVVFALARDGSKFYQHESRVAEATLGSVIGFERLRNDIARAGYLTTPNIQRDGSYCGDVNNDLAAFPQLRALSSIQISPAPDAVLANTVLRSATPSITPHSIVLSGAFGSPDKFPNQVTDDDGSNQYVTLLTEVGPLKRLNFSQKTNQQKDALLAQLFPARRALRFQSMDTGTFAFAVIARTAVTTFGPTIYLDRRAQLNLRNWGPKRCSASLNQVLNVVNIIRYELRDVRSDSGNYPGYNLLIGESTRVPGEESRLELVREEIDAEGNIVPESREIVAEYAVDLRFSVTYVDNPLSATPRLRTEPFDSASVFTVAGSVLAQGATATPQSIRAVRARLSVRSREADREANVSTAAGDVAPGLYRIGLGKDGSAPFARVRTLQSDTFIGSHSEIRW
jgi:hypothetical protein